MAATDFLLVLEYMTESRPRPVILHKAVRSPAVAVELLLPKERKEGQRR